MFYAQIYEIEKNAFKQLKNLKHLVLYSSTLTIIYDQTFSGMENLLQLNLQWNPIQVIETGAFSDLHYLSTLSLYGTRLSMVNPLWFSQLKIPLKLILSNPLSDNDEPWDCEKLCWLKEKEDTGSIRWYSSDGEIFSPECVEGTWESLNCSTGNV